MQVDDGGIIFKDELRFLYGVFVGFTLLQWKDMDLKTRILSWIADSCEVLKFIPKFGLFADESQRLQKSTAEVLRRVLEW